MTVCFAGKKTEHANFTVFGEFLEKIFCKCIKKKPFEQTINFKFHNFNYYFSNNKIMEAKFIWANLASDSIERTTKFYTELGFKANGKHKENEATSFFFGQNKFVINFFTKERLGEDVNGNITIPKDNEVIFSLSANSKEEVNDWVEKVKSAGGTIFSEPQNYEEGYTFGFADPDGHKFNILYWPGM